jgi:hypothetical protein
MAFGDLLGTGSNAANATTNPFAVSAGFTVAAGDLVVVCYAERGNITGGTCTDGLGNTYTEFNAGGDAGSGTVKAYWSLITNAGTCTPSVAATASSNDIGIAAARFEGPFQSPYIDANPAISLTITFPATGTLTQADELVIGYFGSSNGPSNPPTWGNSFTHAVTGSSGTGANTHGGSIG